MYYIYIIYLNILYSKLTGVSSALSAAKCETRLFANFNPDKK